MQTANLKFSRLFEEWEIAEGKRRLFLEKRLTSRFSHAWLNGDTDDREAALFFIFFTRNRDAFHYVMTALQDTDVDISSKAASITVVLLREGYDLGSEVESALKEFGMRIPDWKVISDIALTSLERNMNPPRD